MAVAGVARHQPTVVAPVRSLRGEEAVPVVQTASILKLAARGVALRSAAALRVAALRVAALRVGAVVRAAVARAVARAAVARAAVARAALTPTVVVPTVSKQSDEVLVASLLLDWSVWRWYRVRQYGFASSRLCALAHPERSVAASTREKLPRQAAVWQQATVSLETAVAASCWYQRMLMPRQERMAPRHEALKCSVARCMFCNSGRL